MQIQKAREEKETNQRWYTNNDKTMQLAFLNNNNNYISAITATNMQQEKYSYIGASMKLFTYPS
jgi:hypothetical protein